MSRPDLHGNTGRISHHWIEWLTGLAASLVVLAIIGWTLFEASTADTRPPELEARVLTIDPVASGWRVMVEVRNRADQAAAAVELKGTLLQAGTPVEEAQTTFDYVAAASTTRGGLIFVNDPARYRLRLVPSGFTEP